MIINFFANGGVVEVVSWETSASVEVGAEDEDDIGRGVGELSHEAFDHLFPALATLHLEDGAEGVGTVGIIARVAIEDCAWEGERERGSAERQRQTERERQREGERQRERGRERRVDWEVRGGVMGEARSKAQTRESEIWDCSRVEEIVVDCLVHDLKRDRGGVIVCLRRGGREGEQTSILSAMAPEETKASFCHWEGTQTSSILFRWRTLQSGRGRQSESETEVVRGGKGRGGGGGGGPW
jgi:hypothetical protein